MTSTFLPEWSPVRAIVIAWPYPGSDWQATYAETVECYWEMLAAFASRCETWVLLHPTLDLADWNRELPRRQINSRNVKVLQDIPYDDTWIRDYGPLSLNDRYISFRFNGWGGKYPAEADNQVPSVLAELLDSAVEKVDFVAEGGALEVNGQAVLLANRDCVIDINRNPSLNAGQAEALLKDVLGLQRIEWLEGIQLSGDDTDGHIDTIARFVDDSTLVYAGRNLNHPDAAVLESLHRQIQIIAWKNHWRALELPTPTVKSKIDGGWLPATYANFLICNNYVFVPLYGVDCDEQVVASLAQLFAGREIVPVRCEALLEQHGSLHCATMQIARINKK